MFQLDPSVFGNIKSKADFDRQKVALMAQSKQRGQQSRLGDLQIQQAEKTLNTPKTLGKQELLTAAIQAGGVGNLPPEMQAQLQALDVQNLAKQTTDSRGNVVTNQSLIDLLNGSPTQVGAMPASVASGQRTQGIVPEVGQSRIEGNRYDSGTISPTTHYDPLPADAGFEDIGARADIPLNELPQNLTDPMQVPQELLPSEPNYAGLSRYGAEDARIKYEEDIRGITTGYKKEQYDRGLEAKASYESYKPKADLMLSTIGELLGDDGKLKEGVSEAVGGYLGSQGFQSSVLPATSNQRKFQPFIDQLGGQTFMEAYEGLKGGGQITEIESEKAEKAIARLSQTQDEADFAKALQDLREVANAGLGRAAQKAGVSTGNQAQNTDPLGIFK